MRDKKINMKENKRDKIERAMRDEEKENNMITLGKR